MKTDEDIRTEELDFVVANVDMLAKRANGNFMDRLVRPKKKRVKFTTEQYKEDVLANVEYWREAPIKTYLNWVHGVQGYAEGAIKDQFEYYLTVYRMLNSRPDPELEAADAAKKAKMRALREAQVGMDVFDMGRKCLACFKFMFHRDENNNERHKKKDVCECNSSRSLQNQMKAKTSEYRKDLADKKKIPPKDPMRYKK